MRLPKRLVGTLGGLSFLTMGCTPLQDPNLEFVENFSIQTAPLELEITLGPYSLDCDELEASLFPPTTPDIATEERIRTIIDNLTLVNIFHGTPQEEIKFTYGNYPKVEGMGLRINESGLTITAAHLFSELFGQPFYTIIVAKDLVYLGMNAISVAEIDMSAIYPLNGYQNQTTRVQIREMSLEVGERVTMYSITPSTDGKLSIVRSSGKVTVMGLNPKNNIGGRNRNFVLVDGLSGHEGWGGSPVVDDEGYLVGFFSGLYNGIPRRAYVTPVTPNLSEVITACSVVYPQN